MSKELGPVKFGLAIVFLGLLFGISLGVAFGAGEGLFWSYIQHGIQAHPEIFDEKSAGKIVITSYSIHYTKLYEYHKPAPSAVKPLDSFFFCHL